MNSGIIFAVVAAAAFGLWTIFEKLASDKINYLFGAILVSLVAVIVGLMFFAPKMRSVSFYTDPKGILFSVLAGLCALAIDYFAFKAYGAGLSASIAGPIIIGGSIFVSALIGFLLGEPVTLMKILGLFFIILGSGILAAISS